MVLSTALKEILAGHHVGCEERMTRGWKLFMLLPRMMLFRPRRGKSISRQKLEERVRLFQEGQWRLLLDQSQASDHLAHEVSTRRRRRTTNSLDQRAERAKSLVQLGESSAARVALEGAESGPREFGDVERIDQPRAEIGSPSPRDESRSGPFETRSSIRVGPGSIPHLPPNVEERSRRGSFGHGSGPPLPNFGQ